MTAVWSVLVLLLVLPSVAAAQIIPPWPVLQERMIQMAEEECADHAADAVTRLGGRLPGNAREDFGQRVMEDCYQPAVENTRALMDHLELHPDLTDKFRQCARVMNPTRDYRSLPVASRLLACIQDR